MTTAPAWSPAQRSVTQPLERLRWCDRCNTRYDIRIEHHSLRLDPAGKKCKHGSVVLKDCAGVYVKPACCRAFGSLMVGVNP